MDDTDENLHFNLARAYFDDGKLEKAMHTLKQALVVKPGFTEAEKFVAYLKKKGIEA